MRSVYADVVAAAVLNCPRTAALRPLFDAGGRERPADTFLLALCLDRGVVPLLCSARDVERIAAGVTRRHARCWARWRSSRTCSLTRWNARSRK